MIDLDSSLVRYELLILRILRCFEPKEFSVAITCLGGGVARDWTNGKVADAEGFTCRSVVKQGLPSGGFVVYDTHVSYACQSV